MLGIAVGDSPQGVGNGQSYPVLTGEGSPTLFPPRLHNQIQTFAKAPKI